jgi:hypothetical protein
MQSLPGPRMAPSAFRLGKSILHTMAILSFAIFLRCSIPQWKDDR